MRTTSTSVPRRATWGLKPSRAVVAGLFAFIVAVLLAGVVPEFALILPMVILFLAVTGLTWRRLSPVAMSPVFYFAGYLALIAILGLLLSNALVGAGGTGGVDIVLATTVMANTSNWMLVAATIVMGAGAAVRGRPRPNIRDSAVFDFGDISRYAGWFLVIGTIELVALILFTGINPLLERPNRLVGRGSSIESAVSMAAVAVVVLVAIAFFTRKGVTRLYALLLLAAFIGYFIALGTRRLALLPLLIVLAFAISRRGKVPILAVLVALAAALLALALPLHFRGQPSHGLLAYIASLPSFALTPETVATSFNNFLAGFKITAITGFGSPAIPIEALWVSLNPIAGDSAGWYEISSMLRINRFTPYSAVGELINYGPIAFICVIMGIGLLLGLIQRINDRLLGDPLGRLIAVVSLGLVAIAVIQSAQYNLRADMRYLYFAIGVQLVGLLIMWLRRSLANRSSGTQRRYTARRLEQGP